MNVAHSLVYCGFRTRNLSRKRHVSRPPVVVRLAGRILEPYTYQANRFSRAWEPVYFGMGRAKMLAPASAPIPGKCVSHMRKHQLRRGGRLYHVGNGPIPSKRIFARNPFTWRNLELTQWEIGIYVGMYSTSSENNVQLPYF